MRCACLLAALLAWPAFGSECFCLIDKHDAVWFDCLELQSQTFCLDEETGEQTPVERSELERVADGKPPCTPCRLSDMVDLKRVIRGQNGEQETSPTGTTRPADEEDRP